MSEIICPYCEAECGVPDENTSEGDLMEWECHKCHKEFDYACNYMVDYDSYKKEGSESK